MIHRLLKRVRLFRLAIMIAGLGLVQAVPGQMHKVAQPEVVVRAVGVYEWTGDMAKPTASRLIPISLFIDGHLEDAGVYMARPVPFALDTGTVYEVDQAGLAKGVIELQFARHLQGADLATLFDDGWFGYGSFKTPAAVKTPAVAEKTAAGRRPARRANERVNRVDDDPDRPHLIRKPGSEGDDASPAAAGGKGDAKDSATSSSTSGNSGKDEDPDRPHLTRRPDTSGTAAGSAGDAGQSGSGSAGQGSAQSGGGSNPASDPDRPTLKKRTPEEAKQARREAEQSSVSGTASSLNDDPNRPTLHRGVPTHALVEAELPKLKGVPQNLHQMVAVSDAKTREPHDFARPWQDEAERATVLASMQALARALLDGYGAKAANAGAATSASRTGTATSATSATKAASAPGGKTGAQPEATSRARSNLRRKTTPPTPQQPLPLIDEDLRGYTLSYGGADTFVYMAHTAGDGEALRYVTVVAQRDSLGNLKPAIQSVTDAAHLDRTPWMRLVDVVDAEASNRASLLFELRGQSARQFALYRVIAARSEQTFVTGTTQ
jgi:hypothetical protein